MDDEAFKFIKTTMLAIVAILLLMLVAVGTMAIFSMGGSDAPSKSSNSMTVYKTLEAKESTTQPVQATPKYQPPVQNEKSYEIKKYPQQNTATGRLSQNVNVQTTVHVRTSGSNYYPRYYGRHTSSYRTHRYNTPYPYGFQQRYRSYGTPYYGYGVHRGTYSYNW